MHFTTNGPQKTNIFPTLITRSQLALMDFNNRSELEHATTKAGEKRYICFSKITKSWSSMPMKGKKERSCLKNMVNETIEYALLLIKKVHKHYLRCFNLSPLQCTKHSCCLTRDT